MCYHIDYYYKNRERILKYQREYRLKNRDKRLTTERKSQEKRAGNPLTTIKTLLIQLEDMTGEAVLATEIALKTLLIVLEKE